MPAGAGLLAEQAQGDLRLRPDPEPQRADRRPGPGRRRLYGVRAEGDLYLGRGHRHASCPPGSRSARPPSARCRASSRSATIGLDSRCRVDPVDVAVAVVLTTHDVVRGQRAQRRDHPVLGVEPRVEAGTVGRVGQHARQHLQHVVLHHIAHRTGLVVETAAVGDVEGLGHRDLDALHVGAVQHRLDDRVREAREQHVVQRVEPEPVVDPVDVLLREVLVHGVVELAGAGQVVAEGLLDHDAGALRAPDAVDARGDPAEQERGAPRGSTGCGRRRESPVDIAS